MDNASKISKVEGNMTVWLNAPRIVDRVKWTLNSQLSAAFKNDFISNKIFVSVLKIYDYVGIVVA